MIINEDSYQCKKCHEIYSFETSKPYTPICPTCNIKMEFWDNFDVDTEKRAAAQEKYKRDKAAIEAKKVKCHYCNSTDVDKISTVSKIANTALFGIFGTKRNKQFHCNKCNCDF